MVEALAEAGLVGEEEIPIPSAASSPGCRDGGGPRLMPVTTAPRERPITHPIERGAGIRKRLEELRKRR